MKSDSETIRAFTALSLTDDVIDNILERLMPLRSALAQTNIRWVPVANYHVTLCFIGNIPNGEADRVVEVMAQASKDIQPFELKIGRICLFPDHEKGGVLIADVMLEERLMTLQKRMNGALLDAGYDIYQRPLYRPHLTLARLKKNKIPEALLEAERGFLSNPVSAVHLYKSWKVEGAVRNDIVVSHALGCE